MAKLIKYPITIREKSFCFLYKKNLNHQYLDFEDYKLERVLNEVDKDGDDQEDDRNTDNNWIDVGFIHLTPG